VESSEWEEAGGNRQEELIYLLVYYQFYFGNSLLIPVPLNLHFAYFIKKAMHQFFVLIG
jgi:hypothetical protein